MAQKPPPRRPQAPAKPQPGRPKPPPRDPHRTKLIDKDPWGYNFAQPIWKLDPGAERMKRAPEDRERERIGAVLAREYKLDPKQLGAGFDGEVISWSDMREDKKTPRLALAQATREACLKSRGGVLGIFQTHFLAHKLGLMHTVRAKADSVAFPLRIAFENTVMLDKYQSEYVLHLDRVFYPIFPQPKPVRFAEPLLVADAYRWLDQKGESVVRSPKKEALIGVSGDPHADPRATFEWTLTAQDRVLAFAEQQVRTPGFTVKDERGDVVVSAESALKPDAREFDLTMRIDFVTDVKPWLGFLAVYMDAFTQRAQGILGRAREAAEAKDKALLEDAERDE